MGGRPPVAFVAMVFTGFDQNIAPKPEHHHRDVQRGGMRAAVFGASDGLVSNVGLVLGFAGANPSGGVVRLAGLFGLIVGAVSMAAGEYNSMTAQRELFQRELELERRELRRNPHVEAVELSQIYQSRGIPADQARQMAQSLMADPEQALEVHAREELGIDPNSLGSPMAAASASFFAFAAGAFVPLVPWLFGSGDAAVALSAVLALLAAVAIGVGTARLAGRSWPRVVVRQLAFTLLPAALTFGIGNAIGINLS